MQGAATSFQSPAYSLISPAPSLTYFHSSFTQIKKRRISAAYFPHPLFFFSRQHSFLLIPGFLIISSTKWRLFNVYSHVSTQTVYTNTILDSVYLIYSDRMLSFQFTSYDELLCFLLKVTQ